MHNWIQKLHTRFYSTTPRFPEAGPIPTDCCQALPPPPKQNPGSPIFSPSPSTLTSIVSSILAWPAGFSRVEFRSHEEQSRSLGPIEPFFWSESSVFFFFLLNSLIRSRGYSTKLAEDVDWVSQFWKWVIYSSGWILFLSWRFGCLLTYRASEQWEECASGSGPRSAATITSAFLELFMTPVSTVGTLTHRLIDAQTDDSHERTHTSRQSDRRQTNR